MPLAVFNNRIPSKDLEKVKPNLTPAQYERRELAMKIADHQERLQVQRSVRIHEAEMAKLSLMFLVKFEALLREIRS
jgi:hypothetical protein